MELSDVVARLLTEKYKLEDLASSEIKKLREQSESLTSTCNYLSQQLQETDERGKANEKLIEKIRERHPDIDLNALTDEIIAAEQPVEVVETAPEEYQPEQDFGMGDPTASQDHV